MTSTTTLRKVGGSVMLTLPPAVLAALDLRAGATVSLGVAEGRLVVEPKVRRRYQLDELLAQCQPGDPDEPLREWLDSGPVGNELL